MSNCSEQLAPPLAGLLTRIKKSVIRPFSLEAVFTTFYRNNLWFNGESRSGPGSTLESTKVIRRELPTLIRDLGVRRMLDLPCGDFHWMKEVELGVESYVGADIVLDVVDQNNRRHANEVRRFVKLDITRDSLPAVDLVLCRDCLVHLPVKCIRRALENILASNATYLLTTTFPRRTKNKDIAIAGQWRPLNLQLAPFNFPEPLKLIEERNTWNFQRYPDKSLGLWRIEDLLK